MAEKARFSRLSRRSDWNSQISAQPLDDLKVKNILKTLKDLVYSARGPNGRLKFFQSSSGGHVTVTSTSSKILHSLSGLSHPILRLILAAVQGHLDNYSDGGLQTALLLVSLVQSSLDLPIPRALLTQLYHHSLEILRNHLESCQWKIKLDIGNMKSMMTLINSIIGTKPACRLSESERRHIGVLILQAFVKSLPSGAARQGSPETVLTPERILILTCEGDSVEESKILEGVVLRAPDIATFQLQGTTLVRNSPKVALYNISMAGDTEEWFAGDVRTETAGTGDKFSLTNAVLRQIIKLSDWLVAAGVRVIACQKCVHPFVKTYLRDKGAFVVDRLSILHISAVQRLTGATILSTFSMEISEESFGQLERIDHVVLNDKSYIHLYPKSSSSQINTLVLCSPDETSLEELKTVSQAAVCALYETLACPFVVPGAGCLDTHLASLLRQYAQRSGSRVAEEFACTKGQFVASINNMARCLESLARSLEHDGGGHVTDLTNHHHWSVSPGALTLTPNNPRCLCGLVSRDGSMKWNLMEETVTVSHSNSCPCTDDIVQKVSDNTVLDIFSMKMNSFTTAIETANAILRVHCIVCSSIRDG
ncbi:McKusick-Kaufman/Bardet-Biedl syndromes putative chaperonin-like isoform X1 [Acropora millepora]|uniref:McKusick-Kaufman/Bardet-Biedl syndromes putative chaperonin-like isoform X2 n=1 Tax=Acropora millepora TaxID=45264 RepID=UPI001CF34929|nr:McKusick-Kaufman/Bardet-Biedl syndromes putative chaperonin-like isoform X2 [Acropora millepora]XP_044176062.1 McKusick-Kaufman/Bardet-Biedl syndromes putative chaperonin-like isoform X1 [Acropora millepora]